MADVTGAALDIVGRLDSDTLAALAPGVSAYLQTSASIPAKLAEVQRQKLRARRAGDAETYAMLLRVEQHLELALSQLNPTNYAGLSVVVVVILALVVLIIAMLPRRGSP
jgi:hypothetical protein